MGLLSLPAGQTEPLYSGQLARDYLQKKVNPILIQGLTALCKQKPADPVVRRPLVITHIISTLSAIP